jgi:hypothetical protein
MYSVSCTVFIFMFVPCINSITFLLFQTDAHNYKIIDILKQGTPSSTMYCTPAKQAGMPP